MKLALPILSVLSLFGGVLQAQQPVPVEATFAAPWIESGSLTFLRAASGKFGNDSIRDVVVLRSLIAGNNPVVTNAVYMQNPSRFEYAIALGTTAVDVATLPNAEGGRDGALVLHSDGLRLWTAPTDQELSVKATLQSWAGAQRIWVVEGASGSTWVMGLDASGTSMLRALWNGTAFVPQTAKSVPLGVTQVVSLQWDGNGTRLLAVLAANYVFMTDFELNAVSYTPVASAMPNGAQNLIAVSRGISGVGAPAAERDLLVIYSQFYGSFQAFMVNSGLAEFCPLGSFAAKAMVATDRNGDGYDELAFASASAPEVKLVARTNAVPAFSAAVEPCVCSFDKSPALTTASPQVLLGEDFDADGDADLLALEANPARKHFLFNARINGRPHQIAVIGFNPSASEDEATLPLFVTPPTGVTLQSGESFQVRVDWWLCNDITQSSVVAAGSLPNVNTPYVANAAIPLLIENEHWRNVTPDSFLVHLHVHFEIVSGNGRKRLASALHYFTPDVNAAFNLHNDTLIQRGMPPTQLGGDGNASGNSGGNRPPNLGQGGGGG